MPHPHPDHPSTWKKYRNGLCEVTHLIFILFMAALSLVLWSVFIEPGLLVVNRYEMILPRWPVTESHLRIVVLSDLHVGAPHINQEMLKKIIEKTNQENPDLILLCGDYLITGVVGGNFVAPKDIFSQLSELRAKYGVYAVLGNHDWWWDGKKTAQAIESVGITLLENKNRKIDIDGTPIWLVGIGDKTTRHDDIEQAMDGISKSEFTITFTHSPDLFPKIPHSADLNIAGHTHGGQVNLPLVGRPIAPSRYRQRYAAGVIDENGETYFVTTGVGTSIFPIRFRVVPEISVLEITGDKIIPP
jgi:predicted MPP superfamily phosphohydrolase